MFKHEDINNWTIVEPSRLKINQWLLRCTKTLLKIPKICKIIQTSSNCNGPLANKNENSKVGNNSSDKVNE